MTKEIQHNFLGSFSQILSNLNHSWSDYVISKIEEKDLRILLQKDKFEKLHEITFIGMQWLDDPQQHSNPEYTIYLNPNKHRFRELCGKWGEEAYILLTGQQYEFSHLHEQEILREMLEEFKMDEAITKLNSYYK